MSTQTRKTAGFGAGPLIVIALIVVVALAVSMLLAQDKKEALAESGTSTEAGAQADGHVPFSNYPPEEAPPPRGGSGKRVRDLAPEGLMAEKVWVDAVALADQGYAKSEAAKKAREDGDHAAYQENGKAAKKLFDQALEQTALWEEDLLEKYGELDTQVRKIMRTRSDWFEKVRYFHKTTGR